VREPFAKGYDAGDVSATGNRRASLIERRGMECECPNCGSALRVTVTPVERRTQTSQHDRLSIAEAGVLLGVAAKTLHVQIRDDNAAGRWHPFELEKGEPIRGHGKYFARRTDIVRWRASHLTHWTVRRRVETDAETADP